MQAEEILQLQGQLAAGSTEVLNLRRLLNGMQAKCDLASSKNLVQDRLILSLRDQRAALEAALSSHQAVAQSLEVKCSRLEGLVSSYDSLCLNLEAGNLAELALRESKERLAKMA